MILLSYIINHSLVLFIVTMVLMTSIDECFGKALDNCVDTFLSDLKQELQYFQRTKIVTLLDICRIRKKLLPMLDAWLTSLEETYESLLKFHECLLLNALRYEGNLSDITQMVNENKYIFRNGIKTLQGTLTDSRVSNPVENGITRDTPVPSLISDCN